MKQTEMKGWALNPFLPFSLQPFLLCLFAHLPANDLLSERIRQARDLCYRQDYQAAAEQVQNLCAQNHLDPAGQFWSACLLQMLIYDSGRTGLIDSFYRVSERVLQLCQNRLNRNPADAEAHLYWGLAQLNRANLQSWQGKKLAAFMTLLKVPPHLKQTLSSVSNRGPRAEDQHQNPVSRSSVTGLDKNCLSNDAKFGLGVIEYFKATADRYCLGLGLIGSKGRAYQLMNEAANGDGLLEPMAEFMLGFMMKEDRRFAEGMKVCERLLARYPKNRSARRLLRDIYLEMQRYEQVIAVGRELEQDICSTFPDNRYGIAENWLKMAYAWAGLGQRDSVRVYSERIINWAEFQDSVPWLRNYVQEARRLKAKCK
jgi:tetratricopeptide (TPR) repeat protein